MSQNEQREDRARNYLIALCVPALIGFGAQILIAPEDSMLGTYEIAGIVTGIVAATVLWIARSLRRARP
jgi:hypothetical protein